MIGYGDPQFYDVTSVTNSTLRCDQRHESTLFQQPLAIAERNAA
jgi:hypothetical protein